MPHAKQAVESSAPGIMVSEGAMNRRRWLAGGLLGVAGLAGAGTLCAWAARRKKADAALAGCDGGRPGEDPVRGAPAAPPDPPASAPESGPKVTDEAWAQWSKRGWSKEAYHYTKEEDRAHCGLCPNACRLEDGERGKCRTRLHRAGKLYTVAYSNPCALHVDPIEKKPLFHYLPGAKAFSLATAGCNLRCLNCQNWEISQSRPEETKDAGGEEVRLDPARPRELTFEELRRLTVTPADVVALAEAAGCESIAYTYSEPVAYYEYMRDTAELARKKRIANLWITSGYILEKPLRELAAHLDAANVNLKCFTDEMYQKLNRASLQPVLDTLKTLKAAGVWFEVTHLMVPTYTDDLEAVKKMCAWLLENLGADYPLHFSRFHPQYKLTRLPPTPKEVLLKARELARAAGLRYVYLGNAREVADGETTWCPECKQAVIERRAFRPTAVHLKEGKCGKCGAKVAGVWTRRA